MAFSDVDIASTYFMRRLSATRQAEKLTASMQFDLARAPLSDDELESVVDQFRDSPRPSEGWGLSGVLREVLSTEPKRIPVQDLKALQNNLIASGYAPPDAVADGNWDPSWYAHFRRFDRDNFEEQRSGNHWYSAPVYSGTKALVNTLPSRVFQGIVGGAKGLVMQAPETAERVGALGGALGGAGIGAAVAGPAGALVGGGIGAAVGFFADLLGSDESEEGQSFPGALVDALTPWEEYRDNPRAAWEDLGFVLTAASFASGAGVAARGIQSGRAAMAGLRAGTAGGELAPSALPGIFGSATGTAQGVAQTVAKPGLSWMKAAMMPTKLAAQTELGAFGTIARHVAKTSLFRPGTYGATAEWLAKYSPIAFANRVGPKIALDVFGGASQAAMGARLFGGIGQGTKTALLEAQDAMKAQLGRELTEEEVANLEKTVARSTIEQEVAKAPQLKTGVDIPLLGDVVDLAAFMLYPQKLLPFSAARTARAANNVLKADHLRLAYIHSLMDESRRVGQPMTFAQARAKSAELVTPLEHTWHQMEYGIHAEAHLRIASQYGTRTERAFERGVLSKTKADIRREIIGEAKKYRRGEAPTLTRIMSYAQHDETLFEKWLIEMNVDGRGLSRLPDNRKANELTARLERDIVANKAVIVEDEFTELPKIVWPTDPTRVRPVKKVPNLDVATVEARISTLERKLSRAQKTAARGADSPIKSLLAADIVRNHTAELGSLRKTLDEMRRANSGRVVDDLRLAPARLDFVDKQDLLGMRDEFVRLRDEVVNAATPNAQIEARMHLENYVRGLETKGVITERLRDTALIEKPGMAVAHTLERTAKSAARRFEVPAQIEKQFNDLGYKLVETGEDVIFPTEVEGMLELAGVGDYTRRANFWETLGLSTIQRENLSISKLRDTYIRAELGDALRKHKVKLSPKAANDRLFRYLDERNHKGAVIGPLRVPKEGKIGLYGTNIRDLSMEDIRLAFDDVPGFTEEAAKDVYGALRRGNSYGAEARFLHPFDSFRQLAHGMRIQGAPAISDYMRTLHAEVPTRLNRREWRQGKVRYTPTAELASSAQRKRVEVALHDVQIRSQAPITDGQRNFAMALLDSSVDSQVKAGRFASVDEAYGAMSVEYAERYVGGMNDALFKRVAEAPSFEDLKLRALAYEDTAYWYEGAAKAISELPLYGKHMLPGDREISDLELFTQVLAATSPRVYVERNVELAWEAFKAIKSDAQSWPPGLTESVRGMLDDIVAGRTIDTWGPPRGLKEATGNVTKLHGRPKVWNFYHNLSGDLDKVTIDGWMATLFGHAPGTTPTSLQYQQIADEVTRVADDLGMRPAQVQAALWASIRDEAASHVRIQAVLAEQAGDFAGARKLRASASEYDQAQMGQYTERIFAELKDANPYALMQKVEDEVMGLTQFGPEFTSVMRFFRTADFSTLVHEQAHLLRRLLPEEDVRALERAYGVKHVPVAPTAAPAFTSTPIKVGKQFDASGGEILSRTHEGGGATWDPHTGQFVAAGEPGAGVAVTVNEGTARLIAPDEAAFNDPAAFTAELKKFARSHRKDFENPRYHVGTWKDDEGIHLDVSEIVPSREEAVGLGQLRRQKSVFDLATFDEIEVPKGGPAAWPRAAEERFADDAERHILGKAKLSEAPPAMGVLRDAVARLWGNVRGHAVDTNLVPRGARQVMDKHFAGALGLIPESRRARLAGDVASKQVAAGVTIGAVSGAVEDDEDRLGGALRGAAIGAGLGLGGRAALKRTYGYLPDALQRMNTALRYTLSFTFDAGRITEQNMIAAAKFNLPPMMSPVNYTKGRAWGRSPYRAGEVRGDQAWDDAVRLYDEVNGGGTFASNIDDLDRRMYQAGMLGFSPRNWEIAQTWQLWQRGTMGADEIREAIASIGRYGTKQTAVERSANFVVFPFSFSKKLLTTLGDAVLQHPGRNLLLHEGLRRYQESETNVKVQEFLGKHAPLLEELKGINNLVFGLSPGRFFLAGLDDHRSGSGKTAQLLASFLVPSGAATTLAQAAGNSADLAINAFVPLTITDESINRAGGIKNFMDVMRRYVPFIRELDQYIVGVGDDPSAIGRQWTALMEGADPYYQFAEYQDGLRNAKAVHEPFALAMGYQSVDGLLQSDMGAMVSSELDARQQELAERYPTGFRMSQEFTNKDALDSQALLDLASKSNRSAGEDHILEVIENIQNQTAIAQMVGLDPQISQMLMASSIRTAAAKYADDPRFAELWDRFFLREYGPLRRVA